MNITLLGLRDLLFQYPTTAELNLAKHIEARLPFASADGDLQRRVITHEHGTLIQQADPQGDTFAVQFKTIAADALDQWTHDPRYAVVWDAADWRQSAESRWQRSEIWQQERKLFLAKSAESDRRCRMARRISDILGTRHTANIVPLILAQPNEGALREFLKPFEAAFKTTIYEQPDPADPTEHGADVPQAGADAVGQVPETEGQAPDDHGEGARQAPAADGQDREASAGAE
jgi:hypothetical protein